MNDHERLCEDFSRTFEMFTNEMNEHKIRENLAKMERKLPSVTSRRGRDRLQKNIDEYTRYIDTYNESKKVYEILCKGSKQRVDCKTLVDAKMIWTEEITKYKLFIILGKLQEKYKQLLASYDDVLDEFCFV